MRNLTLAIVSIAALIAGGLALVDRTAGPAAQASAPPLEPRADAPRPFPTLAVSGVAQVSIAPDEAWIHLGVDSFFPKLEAAVSDNDRRITAVLGVLRAAGLTGENLQTDLMSLSETDRYDNGTPHHGFLVRRNITARVTDLEKLEKVVLTLMRSGVTRIDSVSFSHTGLSEKKAAARIQALLAARKKAEAMAAALGQRLGAAVTVTEGVPAVTPINQPTYTNMVVNAGGVSVDGQTFASGRILINVQVSAVFELH